MSTEARGQWSGLGFILAASGSAIGLGNIVFFPGNAYKFGGGAFYIPYFIALALIGIPMMILELGLGQRMRRGLPESLGKVGGRRAEFVGWLAVVNTGVIAMYYVTILGWVLGMAFGALGDLWQEQVPVPGFEAGSLANPQGFFFQLLASGRPMLFVALVWGVNALVVRQGTAGIERLVKIFVPAMWGLMAVLVVRGLSLEGGVQGMLYLFTPDFAAMKDVAVWQGAFTQIFFTLSVGFGVMTAYASYLPETSDTNRNAVLISGLNCGFEFLAGVGIFSILFAMSVVPQASTLSMSFFIVPQGIAGLPGGSVMVVSFGTLFFGLLLLAGISSSVSMVECLTSSLVDKLDWTRARAIAWVCGVGCLGSMIFALPHVVDPALTANGTLGLTLLDLIDHWAFSYGLLLVGFFECLLLGWVFGARRLRESVNATSSWQIGPWFDGLVRYVIPAAILFVLVTNAWGEFSGKLYGVESIGGFAAQGSWLGVLPYVVPVVWLVGSLALAGFLTRARRSGHRQNRSAPSPIATAEHP